MEKEKEKEKKNKEEERHVTTEAIGFSEEAVRMRIGKHIRCGRFLREGSGHQRMEATVFCLVCFFFLKRRAWPRKRFVLYPFRFPSLWAGRSRLGMERIDFRRAGMLFSVIPKLQYLSASPRRLLKQTCGGGTVGEADDGLIVGAFSQFLHIVFEQSLLVILRSARASRNVALYDPNAYHRIVLARKRGSGQHHDVATLNGKKELAWV